MGAFVEEVNKLKDYFLSYYAFSFIYVLQSPISFRQSTC